MGIQVYAPEVTVSWRAGLGEYTPEIAGAVVRIGDYEPYTSVVDDLGT
jgi:hypothetical protein